MSTASSTVNRLTRETTSNRTAPSTIKLIVAKGAFLVKETPREDRKVQLLKRRELEDAYREANSEYDPIWENADSDGLTDETW